MNRSEIDEMLLAPSESLGVEIKSWLDVDQPDVKEKIARTLIALRNNGGGVLIFGFNDEDLKPAVAGRPAEVAVAYHADKIQGIVKHFIVPPFETKVHLGNREGQQFPVVEVPTGVTSPAIARRGGEKIRQNAVYVRSVNNTQVESTEPRSVEDWDALMRTCFDNREADIARFFQRHLAGIAREIRLMPTPGSPTDSIFKAGESAYAARLASLQSQDANG